MKYILEVMYYMTDENCPTYGITFDQEEGSSIDTISLGDTLHESCACQEDSSEFWEEYLRSLSLEWEYGVLYKTVLSVEIKSTKDYWGEVDSDFYVGVLSHCEYSESKDIKLTIGGIL